MHDMIIPATCKNVNMHFIKIIVYPASYNDKNYYKDKTFYRYMYVIIIIVHEILVGLELHSKYI